MPLNCPSKMVRVVNFVFSVFYHNKNNSDTQELDDWDLVTLG